MVHFSGNTFSSHYDGKPGLIAEIIMNGNAVASSGSDWLGAPDIRYAAGDCMKLFPSLNYHFEYNANQMLTDFSPVAVLNPPPECVILPRPVKPCADHGFRKARLIHSGFFRRPPQKEDIPFLHQFAYDILDVPKPQANGRYFVFDLGNEYAGFLKFRICAAAGTIADCAHGEYLLNGHLPGVNDGKKRFMDRYTAKKGVQEFMHPLRRIGCRYIEIRFVCGNPETCSAEYAGLQNTELDGMETPPFSCSDSFWEQTHEITANTLRLCLHEKYENCPWREQSICTYDARNQMLFGYPLWGNYDHARAMIQLFGESVRTDGFTGITAPSHIKCSIPVYTFLWMISLYEYTMYSGDLELFRSFFPQIRWMFSKILRLRRNGLCIPPENEYLWNYCDAPNQEYVPHPPNAFYNLYLAEALRDAAKLCEMTDCGSDSVKFYREQADFLCLTACRYFRNPKTGLYANTITPDGSFESETGHVQLLFLYHHLVPDTDISGVADAMMNGRTEFPGLNLFPHLLDWVFRDGTPELRILFVRKMKEQYGYMMNSGAQTWWECLLGYHYGGGGGSLCHGWSAAPALFESACILGVRPLKPGYEKFRFKPYSAGLNYAEGQAAAPHGIIHVRWKKEKNGIHAELTVPAGCEVCPEQYPEEPLFSLRVNGKEMPCG